MKKMDCVYLAEFNSAGGISLAKFHDIEEARKILKIAFEKAISAAGKTVVQSEYNINDAHIKVKNDNGVETIGYWSIVTELVEVLDKGTV